MYLINYLVMKPSFLTWNTFQIETFSFIQRGQISKYLCRFISNLLETGTLYLIFEVDHEAVGGAHKAIDVDHEAIGGAKEATETKVLISWIWICYLSLDLSNGGDPVRQALMNSKKV